MVELENVPATLLAVSTVQVWPTVGVNPLISPAVSVPPRLAAPVILSWLYCVPTVVPPMETFIVPVESCVYVPDNREQDPLSRVAHRLMVAWARCRRSKR